MKLIDIYRTRENGDSLAALVAARERLIETSPGQEFWYVLMHLIGDCLNDDRQYIKAIETYSTILGQAPNDVIALSNRGNCKWKARQLESALADYEVVIQLACDEIALRSAARISSALGKHSKADEYLGMAMLAYPTSKQVKALQRQFEGRRLENGTRLRRRNKK